MKRTVLQKLILFIFFVVIFLGLSDIPSIMEYNYLANYLVWFLWWPLLMAVSVLSIRFWCMVCPLRLVADIYSKFSLGFKIPKIYKKYKTLGMVLIFLVLHTIVISLNINKLPITTAIYLLVLLQYSALMALLFEKNSFCQFFCPLGGMMNIFSRVGLIRIGTMSKQGCLNCANKACGKKCPVSLSPSELPSQECVFCCNCQDGCSKNNIRFFKVNPLNVSSDQSSHGEVLAITILLGIALAEFRERLEEMAVPGGDWNLIPGKIIEFIPHKLNQIGLNPYLFKIVTTAWEYIIVPVLILAVLTVLLKVIFFGRSFSYHINNLVFSIVPFIYSIFLAVLINYPLTLLYSGPPIVRKLVLVVLLFGGFMMSFYVLIRNLLEGAVKYKSLGEPIQKQTPRF